MKPARPPTACQLPYSPRRVGGACSTTQAIEVVDSPPTDNPCISRSSTNSTDDQEPIWL